MRHRFAAPKILFVVEGRRIRPTQFIGSGQLPVDVFRRAGETGHQGKRRASSVKRRGQVMRSEEHTSELQSQSNLVCRLLLEKKKKKYIRLTDCTMRKT